jgi:hypothetical protein
MEQLRTAVDSTKISDIAAYINSYWSLDLLASIVIQKKSKWSIECLMNKYSASTLFGSFSLQNPLCIVRLKIIITSLSVFLEPCLSLQKRMCNELPLLLIYFPLFTIFSFYRVQATLRTQVASTPIDGTFTSFCPWCSNGTYFTALGYLSLYNIFSLCSVTRNNRATFMQLRNISYGPETFFLILIYI